MKRRHFSRRSPKRVEPIYWHRRALLDDSMAAGAQNSYIIFDPTTIDYSVEMSRFTVRRIKLDLKPVVNSAGNAGYGPTPVWLYWAVLVCGTNDTASYDASFATNTTASEQQEWMAKGVMVPDYTAGIIADTIPCSNQSNGMIDVKSQRKIEKDEVLLLLIRMKIGTPPVANPVQYGARITFTSSVLWQRTLR